MESTVLLNAGTGSVTVSSTKSLTTSSQLLTVTADDMTIQGYINTGSDMIALSCTSSGRTVGLGAGAGQLSITAAEMNFIDSTGMTVGGNQCGSQTIDGVAAANTATLLGILTLLATRDDVKVTFTTNPSTFNAIAVQADNGVMVQADVSTATGILYLDADVENSSTEDNPNEIHLATGRTVAAETQLTFESTTGLFLRAGSLTLLGGSGIAILDSMTTSTKAKTLVLNSDFSEVTLSVWTARSATEANEWRSVTHGDSIFVAVASSGTNRVMTSPDGITWTARSATEATSWNSVTYGNGRFVAVASSGTNRVMTSLDGITWTARSATEANQWYSATY